MRLARHVSAVTTHNFEPLAIASHTQQMTSELVETRKMKLSHDSDELRSDFVVKFI